MPRKPLNAPLGDRHKKVLEDYLRTWDKTGSVRRAGFAHPNQAATRIFKIPQFQLELKRREAAMKKETEITREWIVERLMRIADAGKTLSKYLKVQDDGTLAWDFTGVSEDELSVVSSMMVEMYMEGRGPGAKSVKKFKIDTADPKGALDSLARIAGLFNDKLKVEGEVSLVERLQKGRERLGKATE